LAVALAVGRIVPGLDESSQRWPYVIAGVGFALYGIAVIAYGSARRRSVETALAQGHFPSSPRLAHTALAVGGVLLGLFTVVLILLD